MYIESYMCCVNGAFAERVRYKEGVMQVFCVSCHYVSSPALSLSRMLPTTFHTHTGYVDTLCLRTGVVSI